MAPNIKEDIQLTHEVLEEPMRAQAAPRDYTLAYPALFILGYWHLGAVYGLYLACTSTKWATIIFNLASYSLGAYGVTAGAHRLWAHRAYKAKLPLQIILMLFQTMACQQTVFQWVRDHRLHHKYSDTDADPHNATRGFFFSHVGWLLVRKHPEVIKKGRTIDMSDITSNPVLEFQRKNYLILISLLVFILPAGVPVYFWQETLNNAYHVALLRLVIGANITFSINSVAHIFGNKPYDKNISPTQNPYLSFAAFGEGYHNYHHVFPFDYRVSEFGNNCLNFSTNFIDFFARIGWAYDLKYASNNMIATKSERSGDGTDLWGRVKDDFDCQTSNDILTADKDKSGETRKDLYLKQ